MIKIRYTSDADHVKTIQDALVQSKGYCPCSIDQTSDTKCMCKEFRDKVKSGQIATCHCGLYESYYED